MRIVIGAVGRMKAGAERDLLARYVDRAQKLGRQIGLGGPDLVEIDESRAQAAALRQDDEAVRLLRNTPAGGKVIVLDERGKALSTQELTEILTTWRDHGTPSVMLALGGPDGHGAAMRDVAQLTLSFGRLTWPHMLARIMVAEQVYRVMTVMAGHPYHRE